MYIQCISGKLDIQGQCPQYKGCSDTECVRGELDVQEVTIAYSDTVCGASGTYTQVTKIQAVYSDTRV